MIWVCPACERENGPVEEGEGLLTRFCSFCGNRVSVDPETGIGTTEEGSTERVRRPPPRPTHRVGPGRPLLVLLKGHRVGAELPLPQGMVRIGSDGSDWEFPELGLQAIHFELETKDDATSVRDLSGLPEPGIQVNAHPVREAELHNGDQIHAGSATFLFLRIFRDPAPPEDHGIWGREPFDEEKPPPATVIVPRPERGGPAEGRFGIEVRGEGGNFEMVPLVLGSNVIGRGAVEISLVDPLVSVRHAEIGRLPDGTHFVKDLASANGTYLNERVIEYSPLRPGDEIRVGGTLLVFRELAE